MKALVTGGCGFIGSHLVDVLMAAGDDVVIVDDLSRGRYMWPDRSGSPIHVAASVIDHSAMIETFANHRPDAVYHLAAHHYVPFCEQNPHAAFTTNVTGTLNVIDAAVRAGSVRKFFFASTGDVYAPCGYAHREADPPAPVYIYGETKLICEAILRRYKSSARIPTDIVIGRLFNAAGPRETNPHLLPEIVRQLESGADTIEVGNLWPVRDFVDVRSMARVIRDLTHKSTGLDVFNIGSGQAVTVQAALELLLKAHDGEAKIVSVEARKRPNDRPYLCAAVDKVRGFLGYAAEPFGPETARAIWEEPMPTRLLYR